MKKAYVITNGQSALGILNRLLPDNIVNETEFAFGAFRSSACSLARSVLAVKQRPVVLVVDTDTTDESAIQEQSLLLEELLDYVSPGIRFDVLLAVPKTEMLFLQDQTFVERLANRKFSDTEWEAGRLNPKEFLSDVLGGEDQIAEKILGNLDEQTIHSMQKHPLVNNLHKFLSSVINDNEIYR